MSFMKTRFLKLFSLVLMVFILSGLAVVASAADSSLPVLYGHYEMDVIYSNRDTLPLLGLPQFHGFMTGAGVEKNDSTNFATHFVIMGLKKEVKVGDKTVDGQVECDFFGNDTIGLPAARLRIAKVTYGTDSTKLIVGQDWLPLMNTFPGCLDFSILLMTGHVFQHMPQITLKHDLDNGLNLTLTTFRQERTSFADTMRVPFVGAKAEYNINGIRVAVNGLQRNGRRTVADIDKLTSNLVGLELAIPVGPISLSGEIAQGKGLGAEFYRHGQDFVILNGKTKEVNTSFGWANLGYSINNWSTNLGYGVDDPKNDDLKDVANTVNFLRNQRVYCNIGYALGGGFNVGAEYSDLATDWSDGQKLYGTQVMMNFAYNF